MPAIAASGQVFVLNGELTVTAGPNGYLATGSPIQFIDSHYMNPGDIKYTNFVIPAGARGLAISGNWALGKAFIEVYGTTTGVDYLYQNFAGSGWALAQMPNTVDTSVWLKIINNFSSGETFYYYWIYNLDDFAMWTTVNYTTTRPPFNYGKNTVITNQTVPVSLRDNSQETSYIAYSSGTTFGVPILAAPGAGKRLIIWQTYLGLVGTIACNLSLQDTVNGNLINYIVTNNSSDRLLIHGGLQLPVNSGLFAVGGGPGVGSLISVWYTIESV